MKTCASFFKHTKHVIRIDILSQRGNNIWMQRAKWMEWAVITIRCFSWPKSGLDSQTRLIIANGSAQIESDLWNTIYNAKTWQNSWNGCVRPVFVCIIASIQAIKSIYLFVSQYKCTRICFFSLLHGFNRVISNPSKCLTTLSDRLSLLEIYFLQIDSIIHACSH